MARDFLQAPLVKGDPVRREVTGTDIGTTKRALDIHVSNPITSPVPVFITTGTPVAPDTAVNIYNVACAVIDQEYSQLLPAGTKSFILKARKHSKIKFAYATAAANYLTIESGVSLKDDNTYQTTTLYFRCSKADEVVEIVAYV